MSVQSDRSTKTRSPLRLDARAKRDSRFSGLRRAGVLEAVQERVLERSFAVADDRFSWDVDAEDVRSLALELWFDPRVTRQVCEAFESVWRVCFDSSWVRPEADGVTRFESFELDPGWLTATGIDHGLGTYSSKRPQVLLPVVQSTESQEMLAAAPVGAVVKTTERVQRAQLRAAMFERDTGGSKG